ncbi:hypothetical protein MIND_01338300 [Mycena indigotica]|uniref:Uncharacterized protein n=1 Tax=Mycena indigotica TaxID=2126181 RepID=A0A8H6S1E0_9AGAR|nr:uncharacterized protein MIND_01338300 [Mycena indigotica]KAF7290246.1 hypothetical protein MIND_01338300 [Mycena indigotica]
MRTSMISTLLSLMLALSASATASGSYENAIDARTVVHDHERIARVAEAMQAIRRANADNGKKDDKGKAQPPKKPAPPPKKAPAPPKKADTHLTCPLIPSS